MAGILIIFLILVIILAIGIFVLISSLNKCALPRELLSNKISYSFECIKELLIFKIIVGVIVVIVAIIIIRFILKKFRSK